MRRRSAMGVARIVTSLCLVIGAAACGGDDESTSTEPTTATTAAAATTTDAASPGTSAASTTAAGAGSSTAAPTTAASTGPQKGPGTPAPRPLAEKTKVTIAVSFGVEPFSPLFLAVANGEFEKENLDVEIVTLPSSDATIQVATGRVLMQVGGVTAAGFNAMSQGTGLRYLANVHYQSDENQEGLWIRKNFFLPDGKIDTSKIPGMRIALGSGGLSSVSTLAVQRWLLANGASVADIEAISIGGADMLVGIEQGALDAGYLITPVWQQPSIAECCILVTPQPPLAASAYVVQEDNLTGEGREEVTAVMRALMRTVRTYLQGDYHADTEVMTTLSEAFDTPIDVLSAAPSLRFDPDLPLDTKTLEEAQDMWISLGDIVDYTEPLPLDTVADTSIVEDLVKE